MEDHAAGEIVAKEQDENGNLSGSVELRKKASLLVHDAKIAVIYHQDA